MCKILSATKKFDININDDEFFQKVVVYPQLLPYVKSIEIENVTKNKSQSLLTYKVLPDLNVVMGLQWQGSLYLLEDNQKKRLSHCGISGLQNQYKLFQPENTQTRSILIRLYPWAVNNIFNEVASYITNHAICLSEIVKRTVIEQLEEQIAAANNITDFSNIIQTFLIKLLSDNKDKTNHKSNMIISISKNLLNEGRISTIVEMAKYYGLSRRTLERQFKAVVGLSPKQFIRLSQFQRTLEQLRVGVHWEQIIERYNYYDQAHFINSFKQFSGITPGQLII